ncbi:MAG TPA: methyl-accepting chemotaxis protein [Noviherbaspirillum sp.]|uniref:methyl-accepting chemotaxis protein n=1 Tax=Noviherbaspirillum sp. TaxID=1926288 RepID=UPI002D32853F|nr:methyl-accepting chemotaxis protein [Noviherbaspirillum sp.]HYD96615.1 methyl-accepting chemotaxis protein [Noviherbaspirillum sp.]
MTISNMKISTRLYLLAGMLLAAVAIVGIQGWHALADSNARTARALERAILMEDAIDSARHAQVQFKTQIQEWKNILLRGNDQASFDKYRQAFAKEGDAAQASLAHLKDVLAKAGLDASGAGEAQKALAELQAKYLDALKQFDVANKDSAHAVDAAVKGMDRAPTERLEAIVAYALDQSNKMAQASVAESAASHKTTSMLLFGAVIFVVAAGGAAAFLLVRSIIVPIANAVQVAQTVASGDLTSRIEVTGKDEAAQLMEALKHMNDSLAKIVAEVRKGTDTIGAASSEIASGNMELSSRTEQQASSLEETASSMEELTSTVKQNADNARQANTLAQSASNIAGKGGSVMSEVVTTMGSINDSARKIVDIISVIDGIAFQTNILALNAAVEAARAGEQGRGFAVVAAEVRNLAQRSAGAAKEIKALISDSVEKIDNGSRLVNEAGTTMHEVVEGVKQVTDIMAEISAASQEQTAGIEQINQAVSQMDEVTQQNASLVEEAAASAQAMQEQAHKLQQLVSVFKVDAQQSALAVAAAPARASAAARPAPAPRRAVKTERLPAAHSPSAGGDWEEF